MNRFLSMVAMAMLAGVATAQNKFKVTEVERIDALEVRLTRIETKLDVLTPPKAALITTAPQRLQADDGRWYTLANGKLTACVECNAALPPVAAFAAAGCPCQADGSPCPCVSVSATSYTTYGSGGCGLSSRPLLGAPIRAVKGIFGCGAGAGGGCGFSRGYSAGACSSGACR